MPPASAQLCPPEHNTSFTYSIYEGMGDIFLNGQQQPPSICDKILLSDCWIKVLLKCLLFFSLSLKEKVFWHFNFASKKKESVEDKKKFFFMSTTAGGVK